jgi:hypothetical protein
MRSYPAWWWQGECPEPWTSPLPNIGLPLTASSVRSCVGLPLPCFFHGYGYRPLRRQHT